MLTAACANTLSEFDRTYRSLVQDSAMNGRNLLFVSGLNERFGMMWTLAQQMFFKGGGSVRGAAD